MSAWHRAALAWSATRGLDPITTRPLDAFGGPPPPGPTPFFSEVEASALAGADALIAAIARDLVREVDQAQAELFARRTRDVLTLLEPLCADPLGRLLRVMLLGRAAEILAARPPHALRIRALADYVYSHAALLLHRRAAGGRALPTLEDAVREAPWRQVGPGLRHALVERLTAQGPIHVNLLSVAPGARLRALDCRPEGDLWGAASALGARAAVSGGFFLYSEPDIAPPSRRTDPVGLFVDGGVVHGPPVFCRGALTERLDGSWHIEPVGLVGATLRWPTGAATVQAVGAPHASGAWAMHRAHGDHLPAHPGHTALIVGRQVIAVVAGAAPIPLAGLALALAPGAPRPTAGDRLTWELARPLRAAMAGGPMLLRDGQLVGDLAAEDFAGSAPPQTFSRDETFDQNLLPRMAVGLRPDGSLVFAAVDGRNLHRAPGMTLHSTARVLRAAGAHRATNLDGGSSKRMVIDGAVVDLPTTEVVAGGGVPTRVRPVHTAIAICT